MARYRVQGPDGKIHIFEGPDGATPAQVEAFAAQQFGKPAGPSREQRIADQTAKDRQRYDPTVGMSTGDRLLSGIGSGMTSALRAVGGGRIADAMGLPATREEAQQLDAPLSATTAGNVGQIIGTAAPAALAIPFTPATLAGAAAAGGLTGAALTEGGAGDRLQGGGMGALGGFLGQAAPAVVQTGVGALKGLAEPFVKGGRERIAGRTLQRFATNPLDDAALAAASRPSITGAQPTLAEAARDPGLATLERAIGQMDPQAAASLAARGQANNAARVGVLQDLAGGATRRAAAEGTREAAARPLYEAADAAVVQLDPAFSSFMQRPAFAQAVKQAEQLAKNEGLSDLFFRGANGQPVAITGQGAHYIKKALDDAMDRGSASYMGDAAARATGKTQQAFLGWLDKSVPEYAAAKQTFAELSTPINRMDVGQRLLDRTTAATRDMGGNPRLQANAFSRALNDEEALIRQATGQARGPSALADLLTPDQLGRVGAVRNELETLANLSAAANGPGSQTAKALASQNLMRQIAGPLGLPETFAESVVGQTLARPLQFGMQAAEPRIQEAVARGLLDPAEGARLIALARKADARSAPNPLLQFVQRSVPAAIGGSAAYGASQ